MKKITALALILAFALIFCSSCGGEKLTVDGRVMVFSHAVNNSTGEVIACSADMENVYPGVSVIEVTLKAADGEFTFVTSGGIYTAKYSLEKTTDKTAFYSVIMGNDNGSAAIGVKSKTGDIVEYTLMLSIKGYTVSFYG